MKHDPDKDHQQSIRWVGYDYTEAGAYFVTLRTQRWLCRFGDIVDDTMLLNAAGRMIQSTWDELAEHYVGVQTDTLVVMPNHIHGIITLAPVGTAGPLACPSLDRPLPETEQLQGGVPTGSACPALSLGNVVARFRTLTTKRYSDGVKHYRWPACAGRLWQRHCYERVIPDEQSLNHIRRYIADNAAHWAHDADNPQSHP